MNAQSPGTPDLAVRARRVPGYLGWRMWRVCGGGGAISTSNIEVHCLQAHLGRRR